MDLKEMINKIIEKYNESFISITITKIYNKINLLKESYSLQKNQSSGHIIISDTPLLPDKGYTIEDAKKQKPFQQEQIDKFVRKLESCIPRENLISMYNNLHNLDIREKDLSLIIESIMDNIAMGVKEGSTSGYYIPTNNRIVVYSKNRNIIRRKLFKMKSEDDLEGEYSHELLHMSSTIRLKNKYLVGFNHIYYGKLSRISIGIGLNEGYTELLNERKFNAKSSDGLYAIYKNAAELIENIVGQDKMTQMYFKADLKGLVSELSKYMSQQETKKFIINLDLIANEPNKINEIIEYILNLYNNKIKYDLENQKITTDEATAQYEEFKVKIAELAKKFNEWLETKIKNTEIKIENFDVNKNFEELHMNLTGRSRGNISFATIFICLNLCALLITIITFLCL